MIKVLIFIFIFFVSQTSKIYAKATFLSILNTETGEGTTGLHFSPDGTKLYTGASRTNGTTGPGSSSQDRVYQYSLTTSFDISSQSGTPTFTRVQGNAACGDADFKQPAGVLVSPDGSKIYIADTTGSANGADVCQVPLTTPYDVESADYGNKVLFRLDDGETDVGTGSNESSGIDFNNDGSKLFVESEEDNKIYTFDLSTNYDISSAKYNNIFFDYSNDTSDIADFEFSNDGSILFIADRDNNLILQYSLSRDFDLSSNVKKIGTFNDFVSKYAELASTNTNARIRSLTFNNDGSKVYFSVMIFTRSSKSRVLEYSLDCPYGVAVCADPLDKELVGTIQAYTEMSKRIMKNNINPIMHRIEWLRRNRSNNNLTNQNLKLNFEDEKLALLSKFVPVGLNFNKDEKVKGDWFYWSEGKVSVGEIEEKFNASNKKTDNNNITIGADKRSAKDEFFGYAFQVGRDSADVGSSSSILDTKNYSLIFYGTKPHDNEQFTDIAFGASSLKTEHLRKKNSVNLTGERSGKQVFGSIKLNKIYLKNDININPRAKIDLGFTQLSSFNESGSFDALNYKKHSIPKGMGSLGVLLDKKTKFDNGSTLKPMILLEYIGDFSPSTNTSVSYLSDPNTDYFINIGKESTHNLKTGIGFDLSTISGWSVILNYERENANGSGHTDSLYFTTGWVPNANTKFALSLDKKNSMMVGLNLKTQFPQINKKIKEKN